MESFANYINKKLMRPSTKTNYVAVDTAMLTEIMRHKVEKIYVDEGWYIRVYPDVAQGMQAGKVGSAKDHYVRYGFYEHRMPHEIVVDENFYLSEYEDVRVAVSQRVFPSGQAHFEEVGYREGRVPYPNFKLRLIAELLAS